MMTKPLDIDDLGTLLSIPRARPNTGRMSPGEAEARISATRARRNSGAQGAAAAEAERRRLLTEQTNARASIYGRLLGLRARYANDADPATLPQRWGADAAKIVEDGLAGISNGRLRGRLDSDIAAPLAQERGAVERRAWRGVAQAHAQAREEYLRHLVQNITGPDDPIVAGGVRAYQAMIDNAQHRGLVTPEQALAEKRRGALALCEGQYAAMARRDPARALQELQGEADGHPLLVHLLQERKDALIAAARERESANAIDAEAGERRQQEQAQSASDEAEDAIIADLLGDSPSVTSNSILDNPALSAQARERMLGAVARQNRVEPNAEISQAMAVDLLDCIRRPDGDAEKITTIAPLVEAYNRGALRRADLHFVLKQFADASTPEGATLSRSRYQLVDFIKSLAILPLSSSRRNKV